MIQIQEILNNLLYGLGIIICAYLFVWVFQMQRKLIPESYFSMSEYFVAGIETKNILIRFFYIASYNFILYLVLNNFVKTEFVIPFCILSTLLGAILIVYPAFLNKDQIYNNDIKRKVNYLYVSFIFAALFISSTVMLIMIFIFKETNLSDIIKELRTTLLMYFVQFIFVALFNPFKVNHKLKAAIEKEQETERNEYLLRQAQMEEEDFPVAVETNKIKRGINKIIRLYEKFKEI